jgi:hypothetical protein
MSRAYRVRVSERLTRVVHVEEGVETQLEILNILAREEMGEILANELKEAGFERDGDVVERVDDEGVRIRVNVADGTVSVDAVEELKLNLEQERSGVVWEELLEQAKETLRRDAKEGLEEQAKIEEQALRELVNKKLERKLTSAKADLDRAVNRTTAEALKRRAAQLGEIQAIEEDSESGSLTIRVKV